MSHPLTGKRILVTRSVQQAAALSQRFAALGATPVTFPVICFVPLPSEPLKTAVSQLSQYDWLIFTSGNGVKYFFDMAGEALTGHDGSVTLPKVAAVGSATVRKLTKRGISVDFVPDTFTGQALALGVGELAGKRVLLPRAQRGRPEIVRLLNEQGATVDDIPLYETQTAVPDLAALDELKKGVDVITFTSPSSVRNLFKIVASLPPGSFDMHQAVIACIGPSTAEEAEKNGLTVLIQPENYTIDGLVTAVANYFDHTSPIDTP